MLRLITHIERLLLAQDCVLVPGLGGFVLQVVNAAYNAEEEVFVPMQKEVVFNTTLQHNDGLLSESYMQTYGVDYREAQRMLEGDIEALKARLYADGEVSLGFLGCFRVGAEGKLVFVPDNTAVRAAYSYGLASFNLPKLETLEASVVPQRGEEVSMPQHRDVFYIPISRRLIRTVAGMVAAISLFLLVSTPVKDVNPSTYKASFVPTEIVSYTPAISAPAENPKVAVAPVTPPAPKKVEVVEAPKTETPAAKPEAPKPNRKMYHIVIASFPNQEQADEYLAKVDKSAYAKANVIVRNGKYRVYADRFDNREEAESYLQTVRKNATYKDAWLFISR